MTEEHRCASCSARLRPSQLWCSQCHHPVETSPDQEGDSQRVVAQGGSSPGEVGPGGSRQAAAVPRPHAALPLAPVYQWSRTAAGVTSFGPVGRVVLTLLALAVPLWTLWTMPVMFVVFGVPWCFLLLPWLLRDIWRRERVLPPPPDA